MERLNRTLLTKCAYAWPFGSGQQRAEALPVWLHTYDLYRADTSLGGHPPISRIPVNNLTGQYS